MTLLGNTAFEKVIKVEWGLMVDPNLDKNRLGHLHQTEEKPCGDGEKMAISKPKREASEK